MEAKAVQKPESWEVRLDRNSINAFEKSDENTVLAVLMAHFNTSPETIQNASQSLADFIQGFQGMLTKTKTLEHQGYAIDMIGLAKEKKVALPESTEAILSKYIAETAELFGLDHTYLRP